MDAPIKDFVQMQQFGMKFARDMDLSALNEAAVYLAIATPNERARIKMWFHEGVRNYADGQAHVIYCMAVLDEVSATLV